MAVDVEMEERIDRDLWACRWLVFLLSVVAAAGLRKERTMERSGRRLAGLGLRPVCRGVGLLPTEGDDDGGACVVWPAGSVCPVLEEGGCEGWKREEAVAEVGERKTKTNLHRGRGLRRLKK